MARRTVLLIEDNDGDARIVQEALAAVDPTVDLRVVETGYAAVDYLRRQSPYESAPRPDLILLDLNLPGLTGQQVLAMVKQDGRLRGIPVVVLSSAATPSTIAACLRQADHYVVKPKTWGECVAAIRGALRFLRGDRRGDTGRIIVG